MRAHFFFLWPLLGLVASGLHGQDGKLSLQPHWEPGRAYQLETYTDTSARKPGEKGDGQTMRVVQTTELSVTKDEASSGSLVQVKFASVRGEITDKGKTVSFDSAKPGEENAMLAQALGHAVGKTFTLAYDAEDRFLEPRNLESLSTEPGTVPGLTAVNNAREVANLFRKSIEMGLPKVPVAVGEAWTVDEVIAFPKAGEVRVVMNGKLESLQDREGRKHAKIVFDGTFGNLPAKADKPVPMVELSKDSAMSGILLFDLERRIVSFGAYTTSIKLQAPGMLIPFEQKVTSKMHQVDAAEKK